MSPLVLALLASAPQQARLDAARALERSGQEGEAVVELEAIVRADPTWDVARLELARLRLKAGDDPERAGWHADVARSLAPENPRAHYLWAVAEDEAGRRTPALRALEIALTLRGDYPDARFRLAGLLSAEERWGEAAKAWREVVAAQPGLTGGRLELARALERAGELKAAERELRGLLRIPTVRIPATRRLVELLERTGRAAEAERLAKTLGAAPGRVLRPLKPSSR